MNICLIGGIYGTPHYLRVTPETTLEAGLRGAGHQVTTLGHYGQLDFSAFDLVHVHHLSYGALRLACDRSATPFVFTVHDASQLNGASPGFVRDRALRFILARADRVVSLSRREAAFRLERQGLAPEQSAVLPNGIEASRFTPVRRNGAGHQTPWQLLFAGQLIPLKGCDLLLRALARLDLPTELTLVYQTAELESELRALAASLGIAARVHFRGRLDPGELAALYQRSDLLVLPSATEALPSVLTEAMLSGLPFVATDVGGIPEQTAGFGRLIERRTVDELTAAIREVLGQYPAFARQANAMSEHARRTYSIDAMIERHLALYGEVAGRPARRHRAILRPGNLVARTLLECRRPAPPRPALAPEKS